MDAVKDEKDEAEGAMEKDPNDHSGEPLGQSETGDKGKSDQKESMGSTSKEPGTGEQYVKSSGVAAEGGDFDATKPGAGREADRMSIISSIHDTFLSLTDMTRITRGKRYPPRGKYRSARRDGYRKSIRCWW